MLLLELIKVLCSHQGYFLPHERLVTDFNRRVWVKDRGRNNTQWLL